MKHVKSLAKYIQNTLSKKRHNRSEGLPEGDISSLRMMGWGSGCCRKLFRAAAQPGMGIRLGIRIDDICVKEIK